MTYSPKVAHNRPYDYPKFTGTATYTLSREPLFTRNQDYDFNINQQKRQSYELKPKMGTQVTQMYKEPIITPNLYDPNYYLVKLASKTKRYKISNISLFLKTVLN